MTDNFLQLDRVCVDYYGGYSGCDNVSFSMRSGEILCVFGRGGSGKSSIIKGIAGVEPYSGSIKLGGKELSAIAIKDRNFGLNVKTLPKSGKVFDAIAYPLKIRKVDKAVIKQKVFDIAREWDITHLLQFSVSMLNKEQRVIIALARLFVVERDLYLLDTPLEDIYVTERDSLLIELMAKIRLLNKSVIITTDRLSEVSIINADNNIYLCYNQMQGEGRLRDIARRPSAVVILKLLFDDKINLFDMAYHDKKLSYKGEEVASLELMSQVFESVIGYLPYDKLVIRDKGKYSGVVKGVIRGIDSDIVVVDSDTTVYIKTTADGYNISDSVRYDIDFSHVIVFDSNSEKLIIR